MKKTIMTIVMASLCQIFSVQAQTQQAIDITTRGLQIGEQVPDITFNNLHNYKDKNGKLATTAKLSDFKGKLVILDFWATWCGPCLNMIPKMDSLQAKFNDKLQIVKVTYQTAAQVLPFLEKFQQGKPSMVPDLTDDKSLHKLFPHIYLPHYVWINQDGVVSAITGLEEINKEKISLILEYKNNASLPSKRDMSISYNRYKPLFITENGGNGTTTIAHSIFTGYTEGLTSGYTPDLDSGTYAKITATNRGIVGLFQVAYGEKSHIGLNRVKVLSKDSIKLLPTFSGKPFLDWMRAGNGFCYELMLPREQKSQLYTRMIRELDDYFPQYQASYEKILTKCLVLTRKTNALKSLETKGSKLHMEYSRAGVALTNVPFKNLVRQMSIIYFQRQFPIVDESGIDVNVDLSFSADMTNVSSVNTALAPYGLTFQVADRMIDVLFIKDRVLSSKNPRHEKD